jgi:hypothetical protein
MENADFAMIGPLIKKPAEAGYFSIKTSPKSCWEHPSTGDHP